MLQLARYDLIFLKASGLLFEEFFDCLAHFFAFAFGEGDCVLCTINDPT